MVNTVTDKDFKEALENLDNIRIINSVCSRYTNIIPTDELHRCKLISLWEALKAFDPEGGKKFTSFLYTRVDWECKKEVSNIIKHNSRHAQVNDEILPVLGKIESDTKSSGEVDIKDTINTLPDHFQKVLYQRFFERLTMEEIANNNNYSRETARRHIINALKKLEECLPNGV
tara:strand:- start:136 stop:654 length:519 start_codon:yes stop_codon:yes gene_type:complete